MTENSPSRASESPFFPLPPAASGPRPQRLAVQLNRRQLETLDLAGLGAVLLDLLARLKNQPPADTAETELAQDGTAAIKSVVAVWLLASVGAAAGNPRLVNLRRINRDELHSIGGVARLVRAALDARRQGAA